jgi:dienelactone hydrolase
LAESQPPCQLQQSDTIRIHGYLATPLVGKPHPAIVIGHGHRARGSLELAKAVARFGYVVLSIDGPRAGETTGGPEDTEQAWISVEQVVNMPARLQLSVSCLATTSAFSPAPIGDCSCTGSSVIRIPE